MVESSCEREKQSGEEKIVDLIREAKENASIGAYKTLINDERYKRIKEQEPDLWALIRVQALMSLQDGFIAQARNNTELASGVGGVIRSCDSEISSIKKEMGWNEDANELLGGWIGQGDFAAVDMAVKYGLVDELNPDNISYLRRISKESLKQLIRTSLISTLQIDLNGSQGISEEKEINGIIPQDTKKSEKISLDDINSRMRKNAIELLKLYPHPHID